MLVKEVLPLKEIGEYVNSRYIFVKYELDESDPSNMVVDYDIKAYPTFVFINRDGEEISRRLGANPTKEGFISMIKDATNPNNTFTTYDRRFNENPVVGLEYAKYLNSLQMNKKALEVIEKMLERRSAADCFTTEARKLYPKIVTSVNDKFMNYILNEENATKIKEAIGNIRYSDMVHEISDKIGSQILYNVKQPLNIEVFNSFVNYAAKHPAMQSHYVKFLIDNRKAIVAKDGGVILKNMAETVKSYDGRNVEIFIALANNYKRDDKFIDEMISIYESAIDKTIHFNKQGEYKIYLEYYKNKTK